MVKGRRPDDPGPTTGPTKEAFQNPHTRGNAHHSSQRAQMAVEGAEKQRGSKPVPDKGCAYGVPSKG